jgi:photosynthetic reaction center H subunit
MAPGNWLLSWDLAQISLYAFFAFFLGLVLWLNRESKREGYPLVTPGRPNDRPEGFPGMPEPKTFLLMDGRTVQAPAASDPQPPIAAVRADRSAGSPLIPTGDPMVDGVGPAAYALRSETPDLTFDDRTNRMVPLRLAGEYSVDAEDPDPRGMTVLDADGVAAGTCVDVWVDRSDHLFRYIEVSAPTAAGPRQVMIPVPLIRVDGDRRVVNVKTLLAKHFATAPTLAQPDQITPREEDRVSAYCAGGQLYAKRERQEPLI